MRALLSVANRDGISGFARELQQLGIELYATDGTREHLAADGIDAASVSDLTAVPPLVGGQVRTFHPAIYAGILARRDVPGQLEQLTEHGIGLIDLVVVNVKSFAPEVGRGHIGIDEAIEMIDVAGAALLGAAARNAAGVVAVCGPDHYPGGPRGAQVARPGLRRHPVPAGRRCVQHRGRVLRGDRRVPQPDLEHRLPAASRARAREGGGPAVRREPAPARRLLPGDDAPFREPRGRRPARGCPAHVQQPPRPRRRLPHRRGLHGAHGGHREAHRSRRHRVRRGARGGVPARARHGRRVVLRRDRGRQPRARRRDRSRDRRELLRGGHRARLLAGGAGDPAQQHGARAAVGPALTHGGHARLRDREPRLQARRRRPAPRGDRRARHRSRPAPGRDPAPPDARRAHRPPVRLARRAARALERDRPRPERRDRGDRRRTGERATRRWTSRSAGRAPGRSSP